MSATPDGSIDQETADLILRLQLEDAGVYLESCTGKARDPTDTQLAFELQREQLETVSQPLSDKRMAIGSLTTLSPTSPNPPPGRPAASPSLDV
jgi:hypothetical protein